VESRGRPTIRMVPNGRWIAYLMGLDTSISISLRNERDINWGLRSTCQYSGRNNQRYCTNRSTGGFIIFYLLGILLLRSLPISLRNLTAEFSGGRLAEADREHFMHDDSLTHCIPSTTGRPRAVTIC